MNFSQKEVTLRRREENEKREEKRKRRKKKGGISYNSKILLCIFKQIIIDCVSLNYHKGMKFNNFSHIQNGKDPKRSTKRTKGKK